MPTLRPVAHMEAASRDHPGAWKQYASFLAQRRDFGDWPSWCYCPMAAAYAIVSGGGSNHVPLTRTREIARLGALAAWRPTQGVYRFDPDLLAELLATPLDGDLPVEHLQRLPEWCVYVETPGTPTHGFFAHLEHDTNNGRTELRLLVDTPDGLMPIALHLVGTLEDAVAGFVAEANHQLALSRVPLPAFDVEVMRSIGAMAGSLVSVLLYLCAGDAETRATRDPARRHRDAAPLKRSKNGEPYAPPGKPEVWETGFRLGAALRAARAADHEAADSSVRGHVRRAHWHTFLSGPRDGERKRDLRWLPPIPVNLEAATDPTIRRTT